MQPGESRWRFRGTLTNEEGKVYRVFLKSARSTAIRRHVKIKGEANPYDPSWELYFEERLSAKMCNTLTGSATARYLRCSQEGLCAHCHEPLTPEEGWHIHHLVWRSHGGPDTFANRVLLHPNCHRQVHSEGLVVVKPASREGRS